MFSLISYVVLNVSNFGIFDVNQYSMILRSTPGVLNGLCFMLNAALRFYSEWNTLQLHYNMLITSTFTLHARHCSCQSLCQFQSEDRCWKLWTYICFPCTGKGEIEKKREKENPVYIWTSFHALQKGVGMSIKIFIFWNWTCVKLSMFFFSLLGNCLVCVHSLLQSNTTMPIGNHSIVGT